LANVKLYVLNTVVNYIQTKPLLKGLADQLTEAVVLDMPVYTSGHS